MDNKIMGVAITSFVVVILGLALLITVSDSNNQIQTLSTVSNHTFTASNSTCVRVTTGCIDSLTSVYNTTQLVGDANYSLCRSSSGNNDGVYLDDALFNGYVMNATGQESPNCMYVADSTTRTLTPLIVILFSIAVLAGAIYWVMKSGMVDNF